VDPTQLLDVDVDQLAGTLTFIALGGFQAEAAQATHPLAFEDRCQGRAKSGPLAPVEK
jgi:hypothetical protein